MAGIRNLVCLQILVLTLAGSTMQGDANTGKLGENAANFMEDEQWLSTISQYSRKIKHWNRFRDSKSMGTLMVHGTDCKEGVVSKALISFTVPEDDYIRTVEDPQGSEEILRKAKIAHAARMQHPGLMPHVNSCKACSLSASTPVCGSDGHSYASQCKLEQQACLNGKELSVRCSGPCPCVSEAVIKPKAGTEPTPKTETCTGQDLADLGDRLRDWFQLLHGNAKTSNSGRQGSGTTSVFERNLVAGCKDSIGWMFSKLDTSNDLYLDHSELAAINLEKYEVCIRPFFNSCDSYRDGKVSTAEWCLCFWREKPPCLAEIERLQVQEIAKKKPGLFIPSCDEDGYYRKLQCDQSRAECWCVDPHGTEVTGSRIHGNPNCDELMGYSGDFGSGVGWEDEEEKETEENGEEAEEEEEAEPGETDDGGYI
ncbi:hypothetical protein P4O66_010990, partial [Electrophorus voltai]